jgi:hypothetical protein
MMMDFNLRKCVRVYGGEQEERCAVEIFGRKREGILIKRREEEGRKFF